MNNRFLESLFTFIVVGFIATFLVLCLYEPIFAVVLGIGGLLSWALLTVYLERNDS